MKTTPSKKKIMMAAILTSGLTLAISQAVMAQPDQPDAAGPHEKRGENPHRVQMNSEQQKVREKFLTETMAERKAFAQKNTELRAIMKADTPDPIKASQVAGELFELREKLRGKALEIGIPLPMLLMGQRDTDNDDTTNDMNCHGRW